MMNPGNYFKLQLLAVLLVAVHIFAGSANGQAVSGTISGSVADPGGAIVPGAKIVVTNILTAVEYNAATNEAGLYSVPNLLSGTYRVSVSREGFRTAVRNDVVVAIGSIVRIDLTLAVGEVRESISVEATAELLKSDKVTLGGTVSSVELHALPSLGRNPLSLVRLQPGVIQAPGQEGNPTASRSGNFNVIVNGNPSQTNGHLLDGVLETEGVGGAAPIVPAADAMQELSVNTNSYDVEFGQASGAVMIMTTKSGTNDWHGTGYSYLRNNFLFARNPFTEPRGPGHFVYNQYGGTIGGPIKENKFFIFGHYQGVKVRSGGNILTTVPIQPFREGNFSSLPNNPVFDPATGGPAGVGRTQFPGNIVPQSRISPVSRNLLGLLPAPTQAGTDNNFIAPQTIQVNQDLGTIRADYNLNENNRFFARFTRQQGNSLTTVPAFGRAIFTGSQVEEGNQNSLSADYTKVIRTNLLFEMRFGWTMIEWFRNAVDGDSKPSAEAGIPGLNDACADCGGLAGFSISGPVGAFGFGNSYHAHSVDNYGSYNFVPIVTWATGSHNFKFGSDLNLTWRDRLDTASQGNFGGVGNIVANGFPQGITASPSAPGSGLSTATFLLGLPGGFTRNIYARNLPLAKQNRFAVYAQDTWRVTRKLTLNLGLRWDFIGYPTSPDPVGIANLNFDNVYTIISNYGDTTATANVKNNFGNFGPRIGIAYQLNSKTVIRAGFSRTFTIGYSGANFGAITNDWPNATRQTIVQNDPYTPIFTLSQGPPAFVSGFETLAAAGNPGQYPTPLDSTGFGTDSYNPDNSVDQWNFAIQRQLTGSSSVTVAYVGNAARHLFYRRDYNAALPGPGSFQSRRRYGALGYNVQELNQSNQGSSGYQGLQITGEKRYSKGYSFTTALTWSRAYDFGGHNAMYPWNTNLDRSPQDSDRALIFTVGHVWDLPLGPGKPFLKSNSAVRHLTAGWQFAGVTSFMSGTPFTPTVSNTASLNSDCCTLRPDRLGVGTRSDASRDGWFDKTAFAVPGLYQFGTSGRNILRGPGFMTADWALSKSIFFTETKKLELRWEAFNALNRTNLSNPTAAIDSSVVGLIRSLSNPMRRQQLGAHFTF